MPVPAQELSFGQGITKRKPRQCFGSCCMTVVSVYHVLRRNKITFKVVIKLKEWGVNRRIKDMIGLNSKGMCSKSEMKEATTFIRKNHDRIDRMLNMLADDKSRKVWKSVMLCRAKGRPLNRSLWSDHDQYFVKDIVKIGRDEVFVDGGICWRHNTASFELCEEGQREYSKSDCV